MSRGHDLRGQRQLLAALVALRFFAGDTAALALLATAQIGEGADNGSGVHPKLTAAFSNSYYNSPATG